MHQGDSPRNDSGNQLVLGDVRQGSLLQSGVKWYVYVADSMGDSISRKILLPAHVCPADSAQQKINVEVLNAAIDKADKLKICESLILLFGISAEGSLDEKLLQVFNSVIGVTPKGNSSVEELVQKLFAADPEHIRVIRIQRYIKALLKRVEAEPLEGLSWIFSSP